ncbi:MAG: L-glutamate gamma-semialdehyde dehydrogenase [Verrucomicrobia bacterium]|nr:L-glutamate gamma-semialdehyde dehydrogenase [Verrucomicrobiota bacterium]
MKPLQPVIEAKGWEIFVRMRGETPSVFSRRNLAGRFLDWSAHNAALKAQLFRLVDVLPALRSSRDVAEHAYEYLKHHANALPALARAAIRLSRILPWPAAFAARQSVAQLARNFIVAPTSAQAIPVLRKLRSFPIAFTVDILGETAVSEAEAERYEARYLELIDALADEAERWPRIDQIDCDDRGEHPKVNLSVKVSALYSQIRSPCPEDALFHLSQRLRPLLKRARHRGVFINLDMETTALKEVIFALFQRLLDEPELRDYPHAGIALQAYLKESERDLDRLVQWAKDHRRTITIRLIKGAYWDYETVLAQQRGWPEPVFQHKHETDASFEHLAGRMLENAPQIRCAFATHSVRSIASCIAQAEKAGRPRRSYEFQMLYGMAEPIKSALIQMGYRVRDYCPVGEMLPGMGYLVRRLLENTSNEGFLRVAFSDHLSPKELLRDPEEIERQPSWERDDGQADETARPVSGLTVGGASASGSSSAGMPTEPGGGEHGPHCQVDPEPFQNEPHTDFTSAANRESFADALQAVHGGLNRRYPIFIDNRPIWTQDEIVSINPARPSEVVGRVARAGIAEADAALASARAALRQWSRLSVEQRARFLETTASVLRADRFRFAALEIFETGKNWSESDADVAEAIDFCSYYAAEMRRIGPEHNRVPGELNTLHYLPRGVAVVIAPWNFPLAILCGMTMAALVAGNTVILKPAEQSSVTAAWFLEVLQRAGLPPGVANFLPGYGEEIGEYLVNHPQIDLIAFTGSREVGLRICEAAGRTSPGQTHLKKVVCEMGGKNAVIVDADADLDEAIPGVVFSAFGYQGQKCSALSRVILLDGIYEQALIRLIEAARSLRIGFPEDPATVIGPLIDQAAHGRVRQYVEIGKQEAILAYQGQAPPSDGYFVPPAIFTNVPPKARIAQEEIFGPVLCVLKTKDIDEALALANDSVYALTGGLYSRNPAHIQRAKAEFQAGNLYINRPITGALVGRHPFGGFKLSGGGSKAGGRDYLKHFLLPRVVTENQMRRGFAPAETDGAEFVFGG